ncbi:MAG: hypothetical protein IID18_01865 [Nitrospinae bacterium]|nr:hypothetical protein [Nitrospinota bacterium]
MGNARSANFSLTLLSKTRNVQENNGTVALRETYNAEWLETMGQETRNLFIWGQNVKTSKHIGGGFLTAERMKTAPYPIH